MEVEVYHRSVNFTEFVTLLMGQHKYDVIFGKKQQCPTGEVSVRIEWCASRCLSSAQDRMWG